MKNFLPFLLFIFLISQIHAQVIIDEYDMPQPGDTIRTSSTVSLGNLDFETNGQDITWNFSSLVPLSQQVDTFVTLQETPWVYQLFFLTSANLAQPMQEFDQLPGLQVTDVFNFYKNTSSDYRQVGYGITLNGIPIPTKFNQADKIYQFPVFYGTIDSSESTYEFSLPGIAYSGGWKKRVNHTDGWGTLITPYGTFQTLRIKSEITQYDSLHIDSLGIGFPILRQYTEYKWLGDEFGLPLCTVTKEGPLTTITYIDSVRLLFTRIPEISESGRIEIYPNPVSDKFDVYLNHPASYVIIEILNSSGQKVAALRHSFISGNLSELSLSATQLGLSRGLYFIQVRSDKNIFTHKLLIR